MFGRGLRSRLLIQRLWFGSRLLNGAPDEGFLGLWGRGINRRSSELPETDFRNWSQSQIACSGDNRITTSSPERPGDETNASKSVNDFSEAEAEGRLDGLWYGKATEMRLFSLGP